MKFFFTIISLLSFCLLGCAYLLFPTTGESLSSEELFLKYSGKDMKLMRSMNLWQWGSYYSLNEIEDKVSDIDFPSEPQINSRLPIGTNIILTECNCIKNYSFFFTINSVLKVNGKILLPETNKTIEFEYIWGKDGYLYKAPWEGKGIPDMRYIGNICK